MKLEEYTPSQLTELSQQLKENWGIEYTFTNELIFEVGKRRLRMINDHLKKIYQDFLNIEVVGLYFAQFDKNGKLRLSLEGSIKLGPLASKNFYILNYEQVKLWVSGKDIELESKESSELSVYPLISYESQFLGCGLHSGIKKRIFNLVPKVRRIEILY